MAADHPTDRYKKDVAGMPCYAAKTPMQIVLNTENLVNSVPADDEYCAIAAGCRTQLRTPYVSVGRRRTDLALPHPKGVVKPGHGDTKWAVVRFKNSAEALRVIIEADTGRLDTSQGVVVSLLPPKPSDAPGRTPRSGKVSGRGRRLPGTGHPLVEDRLTRMGVRNLSGSRRK